MLKLLQKHQQSQRTRFYFLQKFLLKAKEERKNFEEDKEK